MKKKVILGIIALVLVGSLLSGRSGRGRNQSSTDSAGTKPQQTVEENVPAEEPEAEVIEEAAEEPSEEVTEATEEEVTEE